MKLFNLILSATMVMFVTAAANAVEVGIVGSNSATVNQGGAFTISISLDNASQSTVQGVDISLVGLAAAGANVLGGTSANQLNAATGSQNPVHLGPLGACVPAAGQCFAGLSSIDNPNFDPNNLAGGIFSPGDDQVFLIRAVSFSPTQGDGSGDPGLDFSFSGSGAIDATIELTAQTVGVFDLNVKSDFSDGVNVISLPDQTFTVTVVPEPGTALLMGLGLAGLTAAGRRQS